MNKENIKKIFGIVIVVMVLLNINLVFAEGDLMQNVSTLQGLFKGIGSTVESVLGGPPWVQGLGAALTSAYTTYNSLGEKVDAEIERDVVNISAHKDDYSYISYDNSDNYYNDLNINFNVDTSDSDIALTDKNVIDLTYIETKPISFYNEDPDNSPDLRVAETTEIDFLNDENGPMPLQVRSILFDDKKGSIEDNFEFRNFLIRYKKIRYKDDPIKIVVDIGTNIWNHLTGKANGGYLLDASKPIDLFDEVTKKMDSDIEEQRQPSEITQRFHLLFNSKSEDVSQIDFDQLDCTSEDGSILGTTGSEYLPNIALNWDFDSIPVERINRSSEGTSSQSDMMLNKENWCDSENNGVYCDATQFSIELLHKVNIINNFINENKNYFQCPPPYTNNELVSDTDNVGLTYLEATRIEDSEMVISFSIGGNYETIDDANLDQSKLLSFQIVVEHKAPNSFEWQEVYNKQKQYLDKDYLKDGTPTTFSEIIPLNNNLGDHDQLRVVVKIVDMAVIVASIESGENANDNLLSLTFTNDASGCDLEKTSMNLKEYVVGNNELLDEIDNVIEFKANLMLDGYSSDFQNDFDDLYRFENGSSPSFYDIESLVGYTPLHKYFSDSSLFNFSTKTSDPSSDLVLPGPGRYEVEIQIIYDSYWHLFNAAGEPTGKINVILNKDMKPEQNMPVYYLPLDGKVGIVDKVRSGYGVSYLQDSIYITNPESPSAYNLKTEGYTSSNALKQIEVDEVKDFDMMNNIERGKILSITSDGSHNNNKIKFVPSRATPVALRVDNDNGDAFAFYKLSIGAPEGEGGQIAHPGYTLTYWTGYNGCEDFSGISLIEAFLSRPDIVVTESELGPVTQSQNFAYGVEWPENEITRNGSVWLKTIFYTPTNYETGSGISRLSLDSRNDEAKLFTADQTNGLLSVELNTLDGYEDKIESIKQIYDMITNKIACVNYEETYFDVYYNPKKVYDVLDPEIEREIYAGNNACIGADPSYPQSHELP